MTYNPTPKLLFAQTVAKTVANSIVEDTLVAAGIGSNTIPANFLVPGRTLKIRASGVLSDVGTPTNNVKVKLGSVVVATTGVVAFTGAHTGAAWSAVLDLTCLSTGVGGTVIGQGSMSVEPNDFEGMPNPSPIVIDTTVPQTVDVTFTWGTANPGNTITCTNLTVEAA
jgi:hypothetical protein